jgi:hypothetical protein
MVVSEVEVRCFVSLIISKMDTSYTAHSIVQYCSLVQIFRTAAAFVCQNALGSPRVSLVSFA